MRAISATWARISLAPSAQLKPIDEGLGVRHRNPERRRRLARQRAAGAVGDGAGDHHRQTNAALVEQALDGEDRGLGVERVEDGLDQEHLGAAVDEAARLLGVGRRQIVERRGAEAGVRHVRRDRRGAVGGAERARDEAAAAVPFLGHDRGGAGELGARHVQLVGELLQTVIGLRDARGGEGVGRDDVGAGLEVGEMDVADRVGPGEVEQIVVAAHLAVPRVEAGTAVARLVEAEGLDHGAHGAVEHEDALGRGLAERGFDLGAVGGLGLELVHCNATFRRPPAPAPGAGRGGGRWHR